MMKFISLICLASLPLAAMAQDITLRLDVPVGTELTFVESSDLSFAVTLNMAGQTMDIDQSLQGQTTGVQRILELGPDGVPVSVEVAFDASSGLTATVAGNQQLQAAPLAGQTVTLVRDGNGVSIAPEVSLDVANTTEMLGYLTLNSEALPNGSVAVGDTWQSSIPFMGTGTAIADITLLGISTEDSREIAEVSFEMSFQDVMEGSDIRGTANGAGQIDVATGVWVATDTTINGQVSGSQTQGGQVVEVAGAMQGSFSETRKFTLPEGRETAATAPPANTDALDTAEPEVFADDTVKITLFGDEVQISIGGETYPGTITDKNGVMLMGTFTASGAVFDFEAERTDTGLVLKSGGAQYDLVAEEQEINPLARQE